MATLSILLSACENEVGEITFDEEPLMVINALFEAEADSNIVELNLTGVSYATLLCNAEVAIYINGKLAETVTSATDRYVIKSRFESGDEVTLEATSDSLGMKASATCIVPEPLEITGTSTTAITKRVQVHQYDSEYSMEPFRRTLISIDNHTKEKRYYRMTVDDETIYYFGQQTYFDPHPVIRYNYSPVFYCNGDMALTDGRPSADSAADDLVDWLEQAPNQYHIFRSNYFDNGCYTLKIDTQQDENHSVDRLRQTTFKVRSITEAEYNYLSGLQKLDQYSGSGIAENAPIVYSNIKGGCGIFAISTAASTRLDEYNLQSLTKEELDEMMKNKPKNNYAFEQ